MNVHFVVDGRALCGPKVNNTGVHGHWHWMCLKRDDELTRCPECVELEQGMVDRHIVKTLRDNLG